jgi:AsmA protein
MKRTVKWFGISLGSLIVLLAVTLIIVPIFFDINRYKPIIENKIASAAGRSFTIEGSLKLSLFPAPGIYCSDVHLGNPQGFSEKDFVYIKSIELRVRLLPLLSKDIQVKRFIIDSPRITLEKSKDGRASWQGLGKSESAIAQKEEGTQTDKGLPIKGLTISEFNISEGEILYIDQISGTRKEVKELDIELKDVSLDKPLAITASADVEGNSVSIVGTAGPIGKEFGKNPVMVDLAVKTMKTLALKVQGSLTDLTGRPGFDLNLKTEPFSPKGVIKSLKPELALNTQDPAALTSMSAGLRIKGTSDNLNITEGLIQLDQSKITFSGTAKVLEEPDLTLQIKLDKIDADRYLPPSEENTAKEKPQSNTDYAPLRKLILSGDIDVGELVIKGLKFSHIQANLKGRNGIFNLDPVSMDAYEGKLAAAAGIDFRGQEPATRVKLNANGIQVRKLISDFIKKDIIEGKAVASMDLSMSGDTSDLIKKTLDGNGEVRITDGAVVGIDLSAMINNVKAAFGKAQPGENKGRTDFSECVIPFEINAGIIKTQNTSLLSPVLRVKAKGNADLSKETLDFRVEPTFVKTLKGQGDTKERSGLTVPVLVTGTFKEPKFSPDLSEALQKSIEKGIDKFLKSKTGENGDAGSTKDAVKGLLKGLLGK